MDNSQENVIKFNTNSDKILDAIYWVVKNYPNVSDLYISKIFYYADKEHLVKYGRPITGDIYFALKNGPVPSLILNILNSKYEYVDHNLILEFRKYVHATRTNAKSSFSILEHTPKKNYDFLSESDIECLEFGIKQCKGLTRRDLIDKAHKELSWRNVWKDARKASPQKMRFEDFFDGDPNAKEKIKELQEISKYVVV